MIVPLDDDEARTLLDPDWRSSINSDLFLIFSFIDSDSLSVDSVFCANICSSSSSRFKYSNCFSFISCSNSSFRFSIKPRRRSEYSNLRASSSLSFALITSVSELTDDRPISIDCRTSTWASSLVFPARTPLGESSAHSSRISFCFRSSSTRASSFRRRTESAGDDDGDDSID